MSFMNLKDNNSIIFIIFVYSICSYTKSKLKVVSNSVSTELKPA
jgi:hypothetical protein